MQSESKALSTAELQFERRAVTNMVLMLAGKLVSMFGTFIYNFAIGLYVLQLTGSGISFATTLLLSILPRVLLGPFAGVFADRLPRKLVVVVTDILSGVVVLGLFVVSGLHGLQLSYIYLASVLLSLVNTLFSVTLDAATPGLVDDKRLVRINSFSQSITSLTQIVAPVIGGMVFVLVDIRLFLIINGLSFLASGITEIFIDFNLNARTQAAVKGSLLADMAAGFAFLRQHSFLYALAWYAVFLNFFSAIGFSVALPFIANTVIGFSEAQYGLIMSLFPAGILAGSLILSARAETAKKFRTLLFSLLFLSVGQLAIGIPALPALLALDIRILFAIYIVVLSLTGVANSFINIPVFVLMQRGTPDEYRGRVFGLLQTASLAIMPVGLILAGFLIEVWPAWTLPMLAGLGMLGLVILMQRNTALRQI